jgi:integrase
MLDPPRYTKWRRKVGGNKVCKTCRHKHAAVVWIDGRAMRPKVCSKCGDPLPTKLTYPKKTAVRWYVREFDSVTGIQKDHACRSSEHADEFIRRQMNEHTRDPVKADLHAYAATLIRQVSADTPDQAIADLITKLGGDPTALSLKPIAWNDARDTIADEMRQKGRSETYIADMVRVLNDFLTTTGVGDLQAVNLDAVARYRSALMNGGWKRGGRDVKPVQGRAVNKNLATLSAFLTRAVKKRWIAVNPLERQPDERIKVKAVRVQYMPDDDLREIIKAADNPWMQAFIVVAYYTAARRSDVLRLEWDRDVDFDGTKVAGEGRSGPHVYVQGAKADTPHWMPLHSAAVDALKALRDRPVITPKVFAVRGFTTNASEVSRAFAKVCIAAGVTKAVERDGKSMVKNRWTLHDLRRKANTDLRNRGASPKERATMLGHRTTVVNEANYEAILPDRERELIDALPAFGAA